MSNGNRLACPNCLSPDHLGENVSGWRGVRSARMHAGDLVIDLDEDRVYDAERDSFFCSNTDCNVDDEIRPDRLVQLDSDGTPLPQQPAEQGRLV